jgi:transcriptional regulator GlxA family with amidase domain
MEDAIKSMVVGFPLYDGVTLMDFVGATDVFSVAYGNFTPIWLADEKRPIKTSAGTFVYPNYSFTDAYPQIDILYIPGGHADGVINNAMFNPTYQNFIKTTATDAQWTGSVCVGSFILAAAGLLNNCTVTTYWSQLDNLRLLQNYCNIQIPEGYPRSVIDDEQKRFTGGGVSSSVDLALRLVQKIKGTWMAQASELYIQYAPYPPVQTGDPTQAPPALLKDVMINQEGNTVLYFDAVQRLLSRI